MMRRHGPDTSDDRLAVAACLVALAFAVAFALLWSVIGCSTLQRACKHGSTPGYRAYGWDRYCGQSISRYLISLGVDGQLRLFDSLPTTWFYEAAQDHPLWGPGPTDPSAILSLVSSKLRAYPRDRWGELQQDVRHYGRDHWMSVAAYFDWGSALRPTQVGQLLAVEYLRRAGIKARGLWYQPVAASRDFDPAVVLPNGEVFILDWDGGDVLVWRRDDSVHGVYAMDARGTYRCD